MNGRLHRAVLPQQGKTAALLLPLQKHFLNDVFIQRI